jgi:hypothetical protein
MEGAKLKRKGIPALAGVAALVLGVGVASAATKYPTKIEFLGTGGPGAQDLTLFGDLNTNRKCRGAREMGLFKDTSYGFKLVDVDLSSFNGAWALKGDLTGQPDLAIKVKRDTRRHGNVVCKPNTITLSGNPMHPRVQ